MNYGLNSSICKVVTDALCARQQYNTAAPITHHQQSKAGCRKSPSGSSPARQTLILALYLWLVAHPSDSTTGNDIF